MYFMFMSQTEITNTALSLFYVSMVYMYASVCFRPVCVCVCVCVCLHAYVCRHDVCVCVYLCVSVYVYLFESV